MGDKKAQAVALLSFGREEDVEDVFADLFVHTCSVIAYIEPEVVFGFSGLDGDLVLFVRVLDAVFNTGVQGIFKDVDKGCVKSRAVDFKISGPLFHIEDQFDPFNGYFCFKNCNQVI